MSRKLLTSAALAALITAALSSPPTPARADEDRGWWVVVGAVPASEDRMTSAAQSEARRIEAAARRCGVITFREFSSKFPLFTQNQLVVVAGSYPSRAIADAIASKTVPCIEGAYVRNSVYKREGRAEGE
jgi:hypothetical protein